MSGISRFICHGLTLPSGTHGTAVGCLATASRPPASYHPLLCRHRYAGIDYFLQFNQPPTNDTFARAAAFPNFALHTAAAWQALEPTPDGKQVRRACPVLPAVPAALPEGKPCQHCAVGGACRLPAGVPAPIPLPLHLSTHPSCLPPPPAGAHPLSTGRRRPV